MKWILCSLLSTVLIAATPKVEPLPADIGPGSRIVQTGEHDVIPVSARLRYTTLIVLPKEEQILDFVCGDKEFWVVQGAENFAFIKPSKAGSSTNVNLVTASGNVYSFTLSESDTKPPDLKVVIIPKDGTLLASLKARPRFVAAADVEDYRAQAAAATASLKRVREDAVLQVKAAAEAAAQASEQYKSALPASLVFDFKYSDMPGFNVAAMWHDDKFTYIRATPHETPAIYELQDDKPSLIHFRFEDGLYTVDKILNRGYLAIGKQRLHFVREAKR